jgi:hypothetical protein
MLATIAGCLGLLADGAGYLVLGFSALDTHASLAEIYAPTDPSAAVHLGLMAWTAVTLWLAWRLFLRPRWRQWSTAAFLLTVASASVVPVWYGGEIIFWSP